MNASESSGSFYLVTDHKDDLARAEREANRTFWTAVICMTAIQTAGFVLLRMLGAPHVIPIALPLIFQVVLFGLVPLLPECFRIVTKDIRNALKERALKRIIEAHKPDNCPSCLMKAISGEKNSELDNDALGKLTGVSYPYWTSPQHVHSGTSQTISITNGSTTGQPPTIMRMTGISGKIVMNTDNADTDAT